MKETFNWGIIGLGNIASKFAIGLKSVPGATLLAVASRSIEKANKFAMEHDAQHAYGSYEEILKTPKIDVVYIATPHHLHAQNTMMCLNAGIAVLCEKPFAINYEEVMSMVALAREKRTFLMEAFWTRFHPHIKKLVELTASNKLGKLNSVTANFGFKATYDPESRLFNKYLGGGTLLDIGIYPVFLSLLLLGRPETIEAEATFTDTEVDMTCSVKMTFQDSAVANIYSSFEEELENEAVIEGEKGYIRIPARWHEPNFLYTKIGDKPEGPMSFFHRGNGYNYQAKELQFQISQRLIESPLMSHEFSLLLMDTLDRIRKIIGLTYPNHDSQQFLKQ
ncbi:MAG: Gfo/Idh/MocA family oxidoreductase [Bacteroidota bacterium]